MPLKVRVGNLNKDRKLNQEAIKKIAAFILHRFKKKDALIDITFVNNKKIAKLNERYMGRKGPTDVLSFLLQASPLSKRKTLVGDVYISSDMAYYNAKRFNTSFPNEVRRYVIHALLHLLNFKDRTAKEKNRIRKLEDKFLKGIDGAAESYRKLK